MEGLNAKDFTAMLRAAAVKIENAKDELTNLDSQIGDGDHGTTMSKVMELVASTAESYSGSDLKGLFAGIGTNILNVGGGATVPLFGSFFGGFAKAEGAETDRADAALIAEMFISGKDRLLKFSKASLGDKTLVDALIPAVSALKENSADGIPTMFEAAAEAAEEGSAKTKDYIAKHGRAKNLGERAIGIPDPGSVSVALMFRAFADRVKGE